MGDWIFDEDINSSTATKLVSIGVTGKHIKDDYAFAGRDDIDVFRFAKQKGKTLLTANSKDFLRISNTELNNSLGIWTVSSDDPDEQVDMVQKAIEITGLKTKNSRKEIKVEIKHSSVTVTYSRSGKRTKYPF